MRRRRTCGFSIIELMVGLAVAGILLAVAVPSIRASAARARLEGAANELAIDLHYIRSEAVRHRAPASLAVDSTGHAYSLAYADPLNGNTITIKTVTLPRNVTVTPNITLTFDALRGMGSAFTLDVLSVDATSSLQVSTNATGRVQVCSPNRNFSGYPGC